MAKYVPKDRVPLPPPGSGDINPIAGSSGRLEFLWNIHAVAGLITESASAEIRSVRAAALGSRRARSTAWLIIIRVASCAALVMIVITRSQVE